MAISQLSLTDFRNLRSTTLDFHPDINLLNGNNGSGKTSLLEAIFVLCQAQSFRTHQLKQCVNHDKTGFLLFGRFEGFKAGLSKNQDKLEIRVDGEVVKRRSDLVFRAPINVINAKSFELIEGSPQTRRQFIDWCLFHVEPEYVRNWREFQHALKQRNRLLKTGRDLELLEYWNQYLIRPSERLSQMRQYYVLALKNIICNELSSMVDGIQFGIEYQRGWPLVLSLQEALTRNRDRDIRSGFTNYGVHRDDIKLTVKNKPVAEVLSRGQSKRLSAAMLLGLLKLVNRDTQKRVTLLVDDLNSELDMASQRQLYQHFSGINLQLFISNIDNSATNIIMGKEVKMFHVEHGIIKPQTAS